MDIRSEQHDMKVINFTTRDFRGSINIESIYKVVSLPDIQATPVGPSYLVGLINLAGTVIPVIDLSLRFNMSIPTCYPLSTPIIICKSQTHLCGVLVDNVIDMVEINHSMIEVSAENSLVSGTIKFNECISLLINTDVLINDDNLYLYS